MPSTPIPVIDDQMLIDALTPADCINVTKQAFADFERGDSIMPHKIYLDLPQFNGDFRAMPCYNKRYNLAGIKWVNSHKDNPKKGLPSVSATMILNNPQTAVPIAFMQASALTALRTGAAGALGVSYCSPESATSIAFIGAGIQAQYQFDCINSIRPLDSIFIYDVNPDAAKQFKRYLAQKTSVTVIIATSIQSAVEQAQLIVLTTPSTQPIIKKEWLQDGTHINAMGADAAGKQECDFAVIKAAQLVVDDITQAAHCGEINVAIKDDIITQANIKATMGDLILNKKSVDKHQLTLFDSTGLAIQDLALAGFYLSTLK